MEAKEKTFSKSIGVNVVKLLSSRVAAQVLSFITAPIMARLFLPEHFGVTQIFSSIASVLVVITCLRYELSIPLGKNEKEASASFTLSLFFTLIFTLVVLALVPFLKGKIAQWFKAPELKVFLWLLPISVFTGGFGYSLRYWAAYKGSFGAMAWSNFSRPLSGKLITIPWALIIGASVTGLFVGSFSGIAVSLLLLLMFLGRRLVSDIKNANLNFEMLWTVAKRHKKFPIFTTWSGLLNTLSFQLPSLILGLYFSTTVVGYYSYGYRLVSLPMSMLGSSVSQVFFPTAAEEYNETGTLSNIVSSTFRRLVQIGVFPMVALGFLGAPLLGFVLGEKWIEAGVYTQILSVYLLLRFVSSPLSTTFSILQRQGTSLAWSTGHLLGRMLGIILGAQIGGARMSLVFYTFFSTIGYIYMLVWVFRNTNAPLRWVAKILLKYIGLSCLLLVPVGCLAWIWKNTFVVLASLGITTIIYVWCLYWFDLTVRNAINNILDNRSIFGQ